MKKNFLIFLFLIVSIISFTIDLDFNNKPLIDVLNYIENETGVKFIILADDIDRFITLSLKDVSLDVALRSILLPYDLDYERISNDTFLIYSTTQKKTAKLMPKIYTLKHTSPELISNYLSLNGIENYVIDEKLVFYVDSEEEYKRIISDIEKLDEKSINGKLLIFSVLKLNKYKEVSTLDDNDLINLYNYSQSYKLFSFVESGYLSYMDVKMPATATSQAIKIAEFTSNEFILRINSEKENKRLELSIGSDVFSTTLKENNQEQNIVLRGKKEIYILRYKILSDVLAEKVKDIRYFDIEENKQMEITAEYFKNRTDLKIQDNKYLLKLSFESIEILGFEFYTNVIYNFSVGIGFESNLFFLTLNDLIKINDLSLQINLRYDLENFYLRNLTIYRFDFDKFKIGVGIEFSNDSTEVVFHTNVDFSRYEIGLKISNDKSFGVLLGVVY
ncbi:STN domain-containing protein [Thermosipho globiformans]|uniref:STN domain-containing protein n=1 Tax=Thermosipho globiformans TaxID=380685 RepID=UPI000F8D4A30|nr:STN domain-containing protein [Thermosipho globiformans]